MNTLLGMRIFESPYALETSFKVKPHPIKKKRRGWNIVKETTPCMYIIAGRDIVAHPECAVKLRNYL